MSVFVARARARACVCVCVCVCVCACVFGVRGPQKGARDDAHMYFTPKLSSSSFLFLLDPQEGDDADIHFALTAPSCFCWIHRREMTLTSTLHLRLLPGFVGSAGGR